MKILVLNCGSSSLKYQLINMETEEVLASGKYERIGEDEAFITHKVNGQKIEIKHPAKTHEEAVDFTLKQLINPEYKVIDSLDEISAIGHRLVHGGEKINKSVIIDDEVIHMYLMNPKAPCFIRDDEENYTYLILPVNISQNQSR